MYFVMTGIMSASKELFLKYPNPVFIETGSLHGDGIQQALDAGFKTIYSIELNSEYYEFCVNRFKDILNVHLVFGDSRIVLDDLLRDIDDPITFWLDAHYCGESICSLLPEIEAIGHHGIKTHTIMIDDLRDLPNYNMGLTVGVLQAKLSLINSKYMFTFEDGYTNNDILIAEIEHNIIYPQFEER